MIKRLNIKVFKEIIIRQSHHLKFINNNNNSIYNNCSFSNNNFGTIRNHNNHIKFYTTINNSNNINNNNNINNINSSNDNNNNSSNNSNSSSNTKEDRNSNNNNNSSSDNNNDNNKNHHSNNNNDNKEYKNEEVDSITRADNIRALGMMIIKISLINYFIRQYIFDFTYSLGTSMEPTISTGAVLLINRLTKDYKVNDLVTAISPTSGDYNICKRIKFVEGDTILFHSPTGSVIYTIPKGYVWIEGDNPNTSKDSRSYGPIPLRLLTGKVILRLNPLSLLKDEPPESETQKLN